MKMYRMAYDAQEAKEERLLENCLAQIRVYDLHVHTVHTYIIYKLYVVFIQYVLVFLFLSVSWVKMVLG